MIPVPGNISRAVSAAAELQGLRPTERSAVEKLARRFQHAGIQGLLHHSPRLNAQHLKGCGGGFGGDIAGALAPPDGGIHFEGRCGRDQLAIVFNVLKQPDQRIGTGFAHKQLGESRRFKKIKTH